MSRIGWLGWRNQIQGGDSTRQLQMAVNTIIYARRAEADMQPTLRTRKIPRSLKPLFWDYDFRELSWPADQDLVTSRILASGDWQAITWLRQQVTSRQLRHWLLERKGRGLDPQRLRFWELILDLPHQTVNGWLRLVEQDAWPRRAGR